MDNLHRTKPGPLTKHVKLALPAMALLLATPAAFSQGTGYWHASGNQVLDSNNQVVRLAGVNWYGFETPDFLAHGLWAQDYKTVLNTIKSNGYNVIRIPFSNQMVESNPIPTNFTSFADGVAANTALVGQTALADLDTLDLPEGADAAPNPEQELIAVEDGERLRRAIAGLPSPFLETLVMRDINGLSYREIAEATQTPVGTVMSRLARARALLGKTLRAEV